MEILLQDLRYALRTLVRSPGFALVAILTLALGIGANSAIFSVVNGVLLKPLPFAEADRLVRLYHVDDEGDRAVMSPPNFLDLAKEADALESAAAYTGAGLNLTGRGDPVRLEGSATSAAFFDVLRVRPLLGRTFRPEENEPGRNRVAVLAYGVWQQRFGGDPAIIGKTVTLNGNPHEVVGVMPEGFSYPARRDVWVPLEYDADFTTDDNRGAWYLSVIGRLKPGASVEEAAAQADAIGKRLQQQYPGSNTGVGMTIFPLHEAIVGDIRPALLVLLGAVGLVLLIACANVANLLLARATAREGEIAVRVALGAGRGRLVRQLVTESLVLSVVGGALGLGLAYWGVWALAALRPRGVPRLDGVELDATVVAFTAAIALLTGLVFGLVPALQVTRGGVGSTLRQGGRGGSGTRGANRLRGGLVVAELALAVMLLAGAGLLIRSFVELSQVDPGFRPASALAFEVALPEAAYDSDERVQGFHAALEERVRALPGVVTAGAVSALPLTGSSFVLSFDVVGRPPARPGEEPTLEVRVATPEYFRAMGIPLKRGRAFGAEDRSGAPPVAVLSEAAVGRHFANEDPIGKTVVLGWTRDSGPVQGTVVGIVGDVKQYGLDQESGPEVYFPSAQVPRPGMDYVLRTSGDPLALAAAVRREVAALDPDLPVEGIRPLEGIVAESVSQSRFYMLLLGIFGTVALVLAVVGIFGVMSFTVVQRTREIGIRMALGAGPGRVRREVVGRGARLALAGVMLGVLLSLAVTRTLSSLLFGVGATDPLTFVAVALLLGGAAVLASWLPARRATDTDPMLALRAE